MKIFTIQKFIDLNYTIPNSDSRLEIKDEPIAYSGMEVDGVSIYLDGVRLLTFGKHWRSSVVRNINGPALIQSGLFGSGNYSEHGIQRNLIDALYYMYNPPRFTKLRGSGLLTSFYRVLYQRINNGYFSNKVTQDMLKALKEEYVKRYASDVCPIDSLEFRKKCHADLHQTFYSDIRICILSGQIGERHKYSLYRYDDGQYFVHNDLDVSEYNLTLEGNYLLYPNQIIYGDRIFDVEEGSCTCATCNNVVPRLSVDTETGDCHVCEENKYKIHNYSTKVPDLLKFKAKNVKPNKEPIYLGCELEYETIDKKIASLKVGKLLRNHAIMKSDGSIRNGFEIVTCPATLDIQLEEFKKFFDNLPSELHVASNVGMHVHVSKKPLTLFTIGKLTAFMNREINKRFIEFIAGRNENHYCKLDTRRTVTFPWTNKSSERYNTLNLNNSETIEFRIFSTPMSFDDFASKVQFCQALVDYAMPANLALPISEITDHSNFIKWLQSNRKSYPQLVAKMKEFA
jgi:hypothetical protein